MLLRAASSVSGTITGFELGQVGGVEQRRFLKTDVAIASGVSGGAAVDASGRLIAIPSTVTSGLQGGATLGDVNVLAPVNLIADLGQDTISQPQPDDSKLPPALEQDEFEPNNTFQEASGPLSPGQAVQGFISYDENPDISSRILDKLLHDQRHPHSAEHLPCIVSEIWIVKLERTLSHAA